VKNVSDCSLQKMPIASDESSQEIPLIPRVDEPADNPIETGCENVSSSTCLSRGSDRPSRPCSFCVKFNVCVKGHSGAD